MTFRFYPLALVPPLANEPVTGIDSRMRTCSLFASFAGGETRTPPLMVIGLLFQTSFLVIGKVSCLTQRR